MNDGKLAIFFGLTQAFLIQHGFLWNKTCHCPRSLGINSQLFDILKLSIEEAEVRRVLGSRHWELIIKWGPEYTVIGMDAGWMADISNPKT